MNSIMLIAALLIGGGQFYKKQYQYTCNNNHSPNEIILTIENNNFDGIDLLNKKLASFPINKIESINDHTNDKYLFFKLSFKECDDDLLHYYVYKISNIDFIETASVNCYLEPLSVNETNDLYFSSQNYFDNIMIDYAWNYEKGDANTLVGIIDTGIDGTHPDLQKNINRGLSHDFSGGNTNLNNEPLVDNVGHGTRIAGIIGATPNNGIGICGINHNVSLVSLKVSNVDSFDGTTYNVIEAINYAKENNIKILNLSWCISNVYELKKAITNYDGLIICASGNNKYNIDENNKTYPSFYNLNNIISVGASDYFDNIASFSNYGKTSVDLFAPGVNIFTTNTTTLMNKSGYINVEGTSFSAPMVTGVASLLLSNNPSLTTSELKNIILNSVDKIDYLENKCVTGGRLNAYKALMSIHQHSYNYKSNDNGHTYECICGEVKSSSNHNFKVSYDTTTHTYKCVCGEAKSSKHSYTFGYIDSKCHGEICSCGYYKNAEAHIIKQGTIVNNKAICLGCKTTLDLNYDMGITPLYDIVYITSNGSYKLPNGIIVLSDEDYNSYINGTLLFNYNDMLLS